MRIESCSLFGEVHTYDGVTQIVVRDLHGSPLAIVVEHAPGVYTVSKRDDHDFSKALHAIGLPDLVVTEVLAKDDPRIILPG